MSIQFCPSLIWQVFVFVGTTCTYLRPPPLLTQGLDVTGNQLVSMHRELLFFPHALRYVGGENVLSTACIPFFCYLNFPLRLARTVNKQTKKSKEHPQGTAGPWTHYKTCVSSLDSGLEQNTQQSEVDRGVDPKRDERSPFDDDAVRDELPESNVCGIPRNAWNDLDATLVPWDDFLVGRT